MDMLNAAPVVAADLFPRTVRSSGSEVEVTFDPHTHVTTGRLVTLVDAPASALARIADPQTWSLSPFFPATYKIERSEGDYRRDPSPPAPGSTWSGLLYEHFRWKVGPFRMSWFLNVLNIDFRVTRGRLDLQYSLHRPLGGGTWFSPVPLGVDVDSGYMRAVEQRDGTRLEVCKKIRFLELNGVSRSPSGDGVFSKVLNLCAPAALEIWLRAISSAWISADGSKADGFHGVSAHQDIQEGHRSARFGE